MKLRFVKLYLERHMEKVKSLSPADLASVTSGAASAG